MTWFRCGGSGIPAALKNRMNAVFNKKFGTAIDYPPNDWPDDVNLMGPLPEKTIVSSPIADFSDGADDVPTKSLIVTIPPTLTGVSSVSETRTGRNLFDNAGLFPASGSVSSYYFKQFDVSSGLIPEIHLKEGVTYTFAVDVTSTIEPFNLSVGCGNGVYTTDILTVYNKSNGRVTITFTPTAAQLSNGDIFAFRCPRYQAQNTFNYSVSNVQLEFGSTAHDYEQYQTPTQYTASLGRTIYGGTADLVTGEGNETWAIVDMGDLTWTYDSTYTRFISSALPNCIKVDYTRRTTILCSAYQVIDDGRQLSNVPDKSIYLSFQSSGSPYTDAFVHDSAYTDANAFRTAVTGQKIVYPIDETNFTFTGQEIPTMIGYNAFWSDQGDTEVTYRADISLALQAVSGSRGLMMASRPVIEPANGDQEPEEFTENNIETEGEQDAR